LSAIIQPNQAFNVINQARNICVFRCLSLFISERRIVVAFVATTANVRFFLKGFAVSVNPTRAAFSRTTVKNAVRFLARDFKDQFADCIRRVA
jgi:hypothetical protein